MTEGRYLHTGLHPNPVDLWAINHWNAGIQRARDAYDRLIVAQGFGTRTTPCVRCGKDTLSPSGHCYHCRRVLEARDSSPWTPCHTDGCKTRTIHDSGLCYPCRRKADRRQRALTEWFVCKRPGCGRATQNAALVCVRCRNGEPPTGPGHHWSLRVRNNT